MRAIVTEKGQVTIPKALRDRLGIRPGDALEFSAEGDRLVATKAVYGVLRPGRSTDALMRSLRGGPAR